MRRVRCSLRPVEAFATIRATMRSLVLMGLQMAAEMILAFVGSAAKEAFVASSDLSRTVACFSSFRRLQMLTRNFRHLQSVPREPKLPQRDHRSRKPVVASLSGHSDHVDGFLSCVRDGLHGIVAWSGASVSQVGPDLCRCRLSGHENTCRWR